ncbi:MAG: AbrB/MazE/SpoVT family DNA-binding domain-containing protein [Gammaproteobacteria bacterium]|jgi:antitoxin VapB|nr:AbrB/MazE/SpoVT family DNA-binding domain-containing protein [Gammaproteobacteria bacterium]
MATRITRVFDNGNSQAVPTPAEFRIDTDRVQISRNPEGDLLRHPLRGQRGEALMQTLQALGEIDETFVVALETERQDRLPIQERDPL